MAATRTQIYLTEQQRRRLDAISRQKSVPLAELIRSAVDHYLDQEPGDVEDALNRTFGVAPDIEVPSRSEWDRGYN